ncbi:MAG: hypothetical protein MUD14_24815 [Hydrococcus sp. Prado102]|jgi:hypothetical protein|nr:hypothetical protein [Hydrococcus sp. Prado102]
MESFCVTWTNDLELRAVFEQIVVKNDLKGSVIILWGNGLKLPLRIKLDVLLKHAQMVFAEDFDTWVYSDRDKWCIEIYHEGEICFGYA